ncbi:hypothetical protein DPMN_036767, partial [Dreissena polymorpha]
TMYLNKNAFPRCSLFPMGDISRDTVLTAVFIEHPNRRDCMLSLTGTPVITAMLRSHRKHLFSKAQYLNCMAHLLSDFNEQVTNPCVEAKSCGQCIAISPRCGWCADTNYDKTYKDRCDLLTNFKEEGCSPANISNPQNKLSFVTDRPVQDGLAEGDAIQIQPQSVNIKIRP